MDSPFVEIINTEPTFDEMLDDILLLHPNGLEEPAPTTPLELTPEQRELFWLARKSGQRVHESSDSDPDEWGLDEWALRKDPSIPEYDVFGQELPRQPSVDPKLLMGDPGTSADEELSADMLSILATLPGVWPADLAGQHLSQKKINKLTAQERESLIANVDKLALMRALGAPHQVLKQLAQQESRHPEASMSGIKSEPGQTADASTLVQKRYRRHPGIRFDKSPKKGKQVDSVPTKPVSATPASRKNPASQRKSASPQKPRSSGPPATRHSSRFPSRYYNSSEDSPLGSSSGMSSPSNAVSSASSYGAGFGDTKYDGSISQYGASPEGESDDSEVYAREVDAMLVDYIAM